MGLRYLNGKTWLQITREERLFCSYLYHDLIGKEKEFVDWLNSQAGQHALDLPTQDDWEIGYEVCFYRDFLRGIENRSVNNSGYSPKRTFDLCLFSDEHIIIIEAKVQQGFTRSQIEEFKKDRDNINLLVGRPVKVSLIAIVSSQYLDNFNKYGKAKDLLSPFEKVITWKKIYQKYGRDLYIKADRTYER
ncbi:MAG: hypothetical protein PHU23_09290 [Dehalococcoidales bacterium]|nr:hypothetical protein [Dehalococcoidales bacterium]